MRRTAIPSRLRLHLIATYDVNIHISQAKRNEHYQMVIFS